MDHKRLVLFTWMVLFITIPFYSQSVNQNYRYKVAACDWMMLKRQKLGEFKLMYELGGDGVEMDMGGLGKRDTFDNKLRQSHFRKIFREEAAKYNLEVPSIAMSGFYGQSFVEKATYKELVQDCLNTMEVMGAKVAYLPLGGTKGWEEPGEVRTELVRRLHEVGEMALAEGKVIGIRTQLNAKDNIKLLKEIKSEGIKVYYCFQSTLENGWNLCKDLKRLGKNRICMIHCSDTDGVTLPYNTRLNMRKVKKTLDRMGWSGWLVVERSRDVDEVRNVKKNFGTNIRYLKKIFQQEE